MTYRNFMALSISLSLILFSQDISSSAIATKAVSSKPTFAYSVPTALSSLQQPETQAFFEQLQPYAQDAYSQSQNFVAYLESLKDAVIQGWDTYPSWFKNQIIASVLFMAGAIGIEQVGGTGAILDHIQLKSLDPQSYWLLICL
jgi:hypothetical protein